MQMEPLQGGEPLAPVTGLNVHAVPEINGVVIRIAYATQLNQPIDTSLRSPNFIVLSAQARTLGEHLIAAANTVDKHAAAAAAELAQSTPAANS